MSDYTGIGIRLDENVGWQTLALNFMDLCVHQGHIIGVNKSGAFVVGEDDDDAGTAIAAVIETPKSDYGTERRKRTRQVTVGYETTGKLKVTQMIDDVEDGPYILAPTDDGLNQHRSRPLPLTRFKSGHYFQFRIENVAGADFSIDDAVVGLMATRR